MDESLVVKLSALSGRRSDDIETAELQRVLPWVSPSVIDLMKQFPLAGAKFTLEESRDESGLGVEMRWLTAAEIGDETLNTYPAIAAIKHGYLPIGECLVGTGDPYFIQLQRTELPVHRVPHTAIDEANNLRAEQVEVVSASLDEFFTNAKVW